MIYFWHDNDDYVLNIHYDSASLDPSKKIGGVETAAEVPAYSPPSGKRGKLKWDPILEEFSWEYIDKVFPPVDKHKAEVQPHQFVHSATTYKYGLATDGSNMKMIYEEVV